MKKEQLIELSIPLVVFVIAIIFAIAGISTGIEHKGFDALLHIKPSIQEDPHIRVIKIDDEAIELGGTFPWSRQITAKGLLVLKEFDAKYVALDIEFLEKAPLGVDAEFIKKELPSQIDTRIREYRDNALDFAKAINEGRLSKGELKDYIPQLEDEGKSFVIATTELVKSAVQDSDILLSNSYSIFKNVGATLNILIVPKDSQDFADSLKSTKNKDQVKFTGEIPFKTTTIVPSISILSQKSKVAGFTNAEPDSDGVKRRVGLIVQKDNEFYGQLIFRPLLDLWGNPPLSYESGALVVKRSAIDPKIQDLRIPLDDTGRMLINWTHNQFEDSFKVISFANFLKMWAHEQNLSDLITQLEDTQIISNIFNASLKGLIEKYQEYANFKSQALQTGDESKFKSALEAKASFIESVKSLLDNEKPLVEKLNELILDPKNSSYKDILTQKLSDSQTLFKGIKYNLESYSKIYKLLATNLKDAICIIGLTGTATTDLGTTPFESKYMNVGLHANVANTIIQGSFLQESPPIVGLILTAIILVAGIVFSRNLPPLRSAILNFAILVGFMLISSLIFIVTGIYIGLLLPGLAMLFSSIGLTLVKFRSSDKEKSFIRNAFSRYLSSDVIKQIMHDPKGLKLGGENAELTAIFTDVKGFSTISEKLSPEDLVSLLNEYLTVMSDIVLDSGGFIDKYEGDAIIGFWGAPIKNEDHALLACRSALKMREAETALNKHFIEAGMSPTPLLTRIGINTGEMVVGNMGTNRRLNYTIMGNAVNLAARLEGVNKKYGTWILISEKTRNDAGDSILYRKLDRVRVVGINTPVRLYEVVAEIATASPELKEKIQLFENALESFEKMDYAKAKLGFDQVLEKYPDDEPSKLYLERSVEFVTNGPKHNWDGVYNLTDK